MGGIEESLQALFVRKSEIGHVDDVVIRRVEVAIEADDRIVTTSGLEDKCILGRRGREDIISGIAVKSVAARVRIAGPNVVALGFVDLGSDDTVQIR